MYWKLKLKKQKPKEGSVRYRIKFAWLPKTTTDGYIIWFERYKAKEEYKRYTCTPPDFPSFTTLKWQEIECKLFVNPEF